MTENLMLIVGQAHGQIRRRVIEQLHGDSLAQLLNEKAKSGSPLETLQIEVKRVLAAVAELTNTFSKRREDPKMPREVNRLGKKVNKFLQSCQLRPTFMVGEREEGGELVLACDYYPSRAYPLLGKAVIDICSLTQHGLLDRVRQCQRTSDGEAGICGIWFFAKKSDGKYCSRDCQLKSDEERKRRKREYARKRYWGEKEKQQRAFRKIRGGHK